MNTPHDGGPAFPVTEIHTSPKGEVERLAVSPGMSLRDWFAGMALQGILAKPELYRPSHAKAAGYAFSQADAMLAARERKEDA